MDKPTIKCALLATLVARHCWGYPIDEDVLLSISKIADREYSAARRTVQQLRSEPYALRRGKRGIELATDGFDVLANELYHECNWEPFEIESRIKHYEGWSNHDWA